jgi:hypothetical protein
VKKISMDRPMALAAARDPVGKRIAGIDEHGNAL